MTITPDTQRQILMALADADNTQNDDAFTIPVEKGCEFARSLAPILQHERALGWNVGCDQGIKWAQGNADRPLKNPYATEKEPRQ